ncbi:class I SAM-dependent methyltransferase [Rhodovulum sp. PH10]|uniref:class I SAM-dependent methyltransferase n=1 Tax=Rhodovulum sp. PH10 TaxID=1187851 RepID=UPI00031B34AD|nr:class I SAM-dependent methyltransferase [Rhodovulum sp. PH10]
MSTCFDARGDAIIDPTRTHKDSFSDIYENQAPPWDTGKPQPPFVDAATQVVGPVLDCGCGTGGMAIYFAERGHTVTGIDFVPKAIESAERKAAEKDGLSVRFLVKDAMTLEQWDESFATVLDSGLFHIYAAEERARYVRGLAHVVRPGGLLLLFSFSDECPASPNGGVSRRELQQAFSDGWTIESLDLRDSELNPAFVAAHPQAFGDGLKMWFAAIRRNA